MSPLDAIVLGIVQGVTEFIPVSSSGHLVIAHELLGVNGNFEFDVLLNIGTLVALIIFYRRKIAQMIKHILRDKDYGLLGKLILATIPAALLGFLFSGFFEKLGEHLYLIVFTLVLLGVLMVWSSRLGKGSKDTLDKITTKDSLLIGVAQTIALVPGVSRSGSTILMARAQRITPEIAAEFSFLLAIPTIMGAILHTMKANDGINFIQNNLSNFLLGNIFSFIFGFMAISALINLLKRSGLVNFGWYRIGLASLLIILNFAKII